MSQQPHLHQLQSRYIHSARMMYLTHAYLRMMYLTHAYFASQTT
jgi:hypothetical protein